MVNRATKRIIPVLGIFVLIVFAFPYIYFSASYYLPATSDHDVDLVLIFPNEEARIKKGIELARKTGSRLFSVAGMTEERYLNSLKGKYSTDDLNFIFCGLSHTTIRDILCLKRALRSFERVLVVTSRYHAPRVDLFTRLMLLNDRKRINIYPVEHLNPSSDRFSEKRISELKKMWGSFGELIIYYLTGIENEVYTPVRTISTFTKNIMAIH